MVNPAAPLPELDTLPFPARHLFNGVMYREAARHFQASRQALVSAATVFTSRGCPFHCQFCSIHLTMGRHWRPRSPENVADEIGQLVRDVDVRHIFFEDDNLTQKPERFIRILELCRERKLEFTWSTPNGVRADTLTEEHIRRFKGSGCVELVVSPESGSQRVINEVIGKKLELEDVENVIRWCVKQGLPVCAYHVIGLIGETRDDIRQTLKWTRKIREMGAHPYCSIALPYYGTRLHALGREKGYLRLPDGEAFEYALLNNEAMIRTPEFDPDFLYEMKERILGFEELGRLQKVILSNPRLAFSAFFSHPWDILKYLLKRFLFGRLRLWWQRIGNREGE